MAKIGLKIFINAEDKFCGSCDLLGKTRVYISVGNNEETDIVAFCSLFKKELVEINKTEGIVEGINCKRCKQCKKAERELQEIKNG